MHRKSYIKAKDKCEIGKNICSRYNKEYTYSFNIERRSTNKKKKSATDNRKMDIILRKENLGDLETKQVSLIHNKTEIAKSDTTSHRSKI